MFNRIMCILMFILFCFRGNAQDEFITSWVPGSADSMITIPTNGGGYNYSVDWGDGSPVDMNAAGNISHKYPSLDTFTVKISGDFPGIYFDGGSEKDKILSVDQWGDIQWSSMEGAFRGCSNLRVPAIDAPDLSQVGSLFQMFFLCTVFNDPVNHWVVDSITDMRGVFCKTAFNQDVSSWNVENVTNMSGMFSTTAFNQNIGSWNISKVTSMAGMLHNCGMSVENYDATLIGWVLQDSLQSGVSLDPVNLSYCLAKSARDSLIINYGWNITTDMPDCTPLFDSSFITTWVPGSADSMITIPTTGSGYNYTVDWGDGSSMDMNVAGDISHKYPSLDTFTIRIIGDFPRIYFIGGSEKDKILSVEQWGDITWTSMMDAFNGCSNIKVPATDAPDLSQVNSTWGIFVGATSFNSSIGHWDVGSVDTMNYMFEEATQFNQDLSSWDVSNVVSMEGMFYNAMSFDQSLGDWDISQVQNMSDMFFGNGLSLANYDATLIGWEQLSSVQMNVQFSAGSSQYCLGEAARDSLMVNYQWMIDDDGINCEPLFDSAFITTWIPKSDDSTIMIPTIGMGYDYAIDWGDGHFGIGTGSHTYKYADIDTFTIRIAGDFPRIFFNSGDYRSNILSIEQWGNIAWASMESAFKGCTNLRIPAVDAPDLTGVSSMDEMFFACQVFNDSINHWKVDSVTSMASTFFVCDSFNQQINDWNVENVKNMSKMFQLTSAFNQDLNSWDVSQVTNMNQMFAETANFNGAIGNWNVGNVTDMSAMFLQAMSFNQELNSWQTDSVIKMNGMFFQAGKFNAPIGNWNVGMVKDMNNMFFGAVKFNQDLSDWDVSQVTNMNSMFYGTSFNQDISNWSVDSVKNMNSMFFGNEDFNQAIGNWNVGKVTNMAKMFELNTSFDQNLGNWNVSKVSDMNNFLNNSGMSTENYDLTLLGWNQLDSLQLGVDFGADSTTYCMGENARDSIMIKYGWNFNDAGKDPGCTVSPCGNFSVFSYGAWDVTPDPGRAAIIWDNFDTALHGPFEACTLDVMLGMQFIVQLADIVIIHGN